MNDSTVQNILSCALGYAIIAAYLSSRYNLPLILTLDIPFTVLGIYLVVKYTSYGLDRMNNRYERQRRRQEALKEAAIYLAPYDDIWSNLRLSNKFCSLYLASDGVSIRAKEKVEPYREFRIIQSEVHTYEDLWNMFCVTFCHNMKYDELVEDCRLYQAKIIETSAATLPKPNTSDTKIKKPAFEIIDINNCSEVEMTSLPGISIVMAKKAVKKRAQINGFKSVDDFILFLRIKPHIEKQLRELICANKIVGISKIVLNKERMVDL